MTKKTENYQYIWIFMGEGSSLPTAVFTSKEDALEWIVKHKLRGYLGLFPVGIGVYDWTIETGRIKADHKFYANRQTFATGYLDHVHIDDGFYEWRKEIEDDTQVPPEQSE